MTKRQKKSQTAKQAMKRGTAPEFMDRHKINTELLKQQTNGIPHEMWFRVR